MEYLDHTNGKSILGSVSSVLIGGIAHFTQNDLLVWVSIITGLVTIGYTVDKWVQSHRKKRDNNLNE